jgi:hypothetical protein
MRLSEERRKHTEQFLEQTLKKQAKLYQAQIENLRDHWSLPTSDRKKAILQTHNQHLQIMSQAIIDAYRTSYLQEQLLLDGNDIVDVVNRISFHLNNRLQACVASLPVNLSMSGDTEMIIREILSDADANLRIFLKAMELNSKPENQTSAEPVDLSFVADDRIRAIIERDYVELSKLSPSETPKAALVLSGSIIEGLIFDALVADGKYTFDEACAKYLNDMIGAAVGRSIVTSDKLTHAIRLYRNLIHPGREIKYSMVFSESDANLARHAVDIIIREIKAWRAKNP